MSPDGARFHIHEARAQHRLNVCTGHVQYVLHTYRTCPAQTQPYSRRRLLITADSWSYYPPSPLRGLTYYGYGPWTGPPLTKHSAWLIESWLVCFGRGTTRAEDAQGTPTQRHISPSILVYEDDCIRVY